MKRTKNNRQISDMAQSIANRLKDFYEDSYCNREANKQVNYNELENMIAHLEDVSRVLKQAYEQTH